MPGASLVLQMPNMGRPDLWMHHKVRYTVVGLLPLLELPPIELVVVVVIQSVAQPTNKCMDLEVDAYKLVDLLSIMEHYSPDAGDSVVRAN